MTFSCLISCYKNDKPEQLREALASLNKQTVKANEIVFVEDGILSKGLYLVLEEFEDELPLKRINIEVNKGLGNALNIGLKSCSNNLVFRMDTDDICHPQRFEKQIQYLKQHPDIDILGTWAKDIDDDGNIIGERTFPTSHKDLLKIMWTCPVAHPTILFKRDAILEIGSYRGDLKRRQDYELWFRAASKGLIFGNVPEYLLYYRFTPNFYKKNNFKVSWQETKMGIGGLRKLKVRNPLPYLAMFYPLVRSLLPYFIAKRLQKLAGKIDPRKQSSQESF